MRQDVGDVAVHEDVAGLEAQDGCLWAARVRAADPENLGVLAACEGGEERWVRGRSAGCPLTVLGQGGRKGVIARGLRLVCGGRWLT